ncbi:MAG: Lrp/AsnC family transcriptional regulator [Halobacteriaceae archaeon]
MVTAYILVKATTHEADRLQREIGAVDGVEEAFIVAGDVDLIATLVVERPSMVKDVAADQIGRIEGVETTETYVAMD